MPGSSKSVGIFQVRYWSGLPFPSLGNLRNPGIEPRSPVLPGGFFTTEPPGKPIKVLGHTWNDPPIVWLEEFQQSSFSPFSSLICKMLLLTVCFMVLMCSCTLSTILKTELSWLTNTFCSNYFNPYTIIRMRKESQKGGSLILPRLPKVNKIISAEFHSWFQQLTVFTLTRSSFPYPLNEVNHIYFLSFHSSPDILRLGRVIRCFGFESVHWVGSW